MNWIMKIVFSMWWGINRSNKFIQSIQVGVVRVVQSNSKQQVRSDLGLKLIKMILYRKFDDSDWPSGFRCYIQIQKDPRSNTFRYSAGLCEPVSLRGSLWLLGRNQYPNTVIKIKLGRLPPRRVPKFDCGAPISS